MDDTLLSELRGLRSEMQHEFDEVKRKQDATNGRVRALELWQATVKGGARVGAWVGPIASGVLIGVILHLLG